MNEADTREELIERRSTEPGMSLRNSVTVESPYGLRTFALRVGDITCAPDPVLVVPTHANLEYRPDGQVLSRVERTYGADFHKAEVVVTGRSGFIATYRLPNRGSFSGNEILLVRIPGKRDADRFADDPLDFLSESLWTLYGSLAALELRTNKLTSLAMPLLAGTRGYQVQNLLKVILNHSLEWLRVSRYMNAVNFYLTDSEGVKQWNTAMDEVLGRHSVDSAHRASANALRNEILSVLNGTKINMLPDSWNEVVNELRVSLQSKVIPLERVAVAARRLTELIVSWQLVEMGDVPKGHLGPRLDALKAKKIIAPWILAHLECLKLFGNAAAHSNEDVSYDPPSLRPDDLLGLLSSLQRVLEFSIGKLKE